MRLLVWPTCLLLFLTELICLFADILWSPDRILDRDFAFVIVSEPVTPSNQIDIVDRIVQKYNRALFPIMKHIL